MDDWHHVAGEAINAHEANHEDDERDDGGNRGPALGARERSEEGSPDSQSRAGIIRQSAPVAIFVEP